MRGTRCAFPETLTTERSTREGKGTPWAESPGRTGPAALCVLTAAPQRHRVAAGRTRVPPRGARLRWNPERLLRWSLGPGTLHLEWLTSSVLPPALPGRTKGSGSERLGGPRRTWFPAGTSQSCFQQWLLMSLSGAFSPQPSACATCLLEDLRSSPVKSFQGQI